MSPDSILTLIVASALLLYLGRRLLGTRDLLLVLGAAGAVGFMLAGFYHRWALVVGLVLLAGVASSLYFNNRGEPRGVLAGVLDEYLRVEAGTAFVMGVGIAIFLVFTIEEGNKNIDALAGHLAIYEPNSSIEWIPRVDNSVVGRWMLETDDPASDVIAFYHALGEREGWAITSHSPSSFISMHRGTLGVSILASQTGRRGGTSAVITLERK